MISVFKIFEELNESNSGNHKKAVLTQYKDHELLNRVLKMTYDTVDFTYGLTLPNVMKLTPTEDYNMTLTNALNMLDGTINTRELTGNAALKYTRNLINSLESDDAEVLKLVLNRNIKCNVGRTLINKIIPGLITKTVYMRCGTYNEKTQKKIKFPALLQLKADGTYREFTVNNGEVSAKSRSSESYEYPVLFELMKDLPCGVYTGELTVKGITDRAEGNGMINSSEPPHADIVLDLWDYITLEEYKNAGAKVKNTTPYKNRFDTLLQILKDVKGANIGAIACRTVHTVQEALKGTSEWMNQGYEGAVLKNESGLFKDGTSTDQLKVKLIIDCEMRITGFQDGKIGSKRDGKVGSIIFENDEGTIKGKCSGFSDKQLDDMTANPDRYLGKIMTVQFNDLTKSESNDYHALSHPRFIEVRNDKNETDSLEKVLDSKEMAMMLGDAT